MDNNIQFFREKHGWSLAQLAGRCEPSTTAVQVSRLEKGTRNLTHDWMKRLSKPLGCEPEDLIRSLGRLTQQDSNTFAMGEEQRQRTSEDYVNIRVYDIRASAGNGFLLDDHTAVIDELAFKLTWLKRRTSASLDRLAIIKVRGDSMEPTLNDDDDVLIDQTQTRIAGGGIFVIEEEGQISVKRLTIAKAGIKVISDNPNYPPYESDKVLVVGRVIWRGQNL